MSAATLGEDADLGGVARNVERGAAQLQLGTVPGVLGRNKKELCIYRVIEVRLSALAPFIHLVSSFALELRKLCKRLELEGAARMHHHLLLGEAVLALDICTCDT